MTRTVFLCLLLTSFAAVGCRESEQNRQMTLEKGTYQGPADTPLDEEALSRLRERNQLQRF